MNINTIKKIIKSLLQDKRKRVFLISLGVLAFTIPIVLLIKPSLVRSWYDPTYQYRKPVTITYSGSTLTNYDVLIEVDTASLISGSKMQSDCDDIRFADSDDTTALAYWVEGGCNTSTTQIWVTVPSIPDGGKDIYIYYGNGSATNAEETWSGNFLTLNTASCPTGWTSVSGSGGTYENKFIRASSSYGTTGGASSHSHAQVSCSVSGGVNANIRTGGGHAWTSTNHSHTGAKVDVDTATNVLPPYLDMIVCSNNDLNIKANQVTLFSSTVPTGWTRFSALDSKFPRGATSYGGTGGASTHTHSTTGGYQTGTSGQNTNGNAPDGGSYVLANHYHTSENGTTGAGNSIPAYTNTIYGQANADIAPVSGTIVMGTAIPPLGWTRLSSLDNTFLQGNSSYGGTGGSDTHTHSVTVTVGQNNYNFQEVDGSGGGGLWYHTHSCSTTTDSQSNIPPYVQTVIVQKDTPATSTALGAEELHNLPPEIPSLDSPSDSASSVVLTPQLKTTTTDSEGDYIRYKIEVCTDSGMTANCQTFDQTTSQAGWSGQDAQTSTAYATGTQATYTVQTALDPGTEYFWRSYGTDPEGSTIWGSTQASPYSFTTNELPSVPSQDSPSDTQTNTSVALPIKITSTDADSDYLRYKVQLCTNLAMSQNCTTADQTSSQSGWSGQNAQTGSAYTSGTQATYTPTSSLTTATTYYWRAYAIDPAGTNIFTAATSIRSFTVTTAPDAPEDLETNGSTDPTGVTTTTPQFTAVHNDADGDSANGYRIQVNTKSDFTGTMMWDPGTAAMTTTTDGSRSPQILYAGSVIPVDGKTYYWRISFIDTNLAESAWSETAQFQMAKLEVPTGCYVVKAHDNSSITLHWEDTNSIEDGYDIQRSVNGGAYSLLISKSAGATSHEDTGVSTGNTYQYKILGTINSEAGPACTTTLVDLHEGGFLIY